MHRLFLLGPAQVTDVPEKVLGLLGKDVTITCKASGFPRAHITWFDKTGQPAPRCCRQGVVNRDGQSSLTIKGLETGDKGRYTCKASSDNGAPDYASVDLTVYGMWNVCQPFNHLSRKIREINSLFLPCILIAGTQVNIFI